MRVKATLAILAAAGAALISAVPASAITCPPGTEPTVVMVGGKLVLAGCRPAVHCDPVACFAVTP